MSRPLVFEASTPLAAPAERVFDFHQNPRNLILVAPRSLRVMSIEAEPVARPGATFRIRASQFGIPLDWTGLWEIVEPPVLLVDSAPRCPFPGWRHEHHFLPSERGCVLTDRVSFEPPGGVVGHAAFRIFLAAMFQARHRATRALFARKPASGPSPTRCTPLVCSAPNPALFRLIGPC
ncbi:MAG: SRPBCC family protein, partial [Terrimicrobiaceae bacterium]|nr:SRPBCC family protein [Terrimicrobiaceae bacterium]